MIIIKKKTNTKVAASKMKHQLFSKQRILGVLLIIIGSDISLELTQTCSWITCRLKKVFSEIWQNSQENTCDRVSFLIKLQAWPATLWKKRLCHKCFPVNFVKFLRTLFTQNNSGGCFYFISFMKMQKENRPVFGFMKTEYESIKNSK